MKGQELLNEQRIAEVRKMNPVNAGLAHWANELHTASIRRRAADARYWNALEQFNCRYAEHAQELR